MVTSEFSFRKNCCVLVLFAVDMKYIILSTLIMWMFFLGNSAYLTLGYRLYMFQFSYCLLMSGTINSPM